MKPFIKSAVLMLTKKRINDKQLSCVEMRIHKSNLMYFNLSTNPVYSFELDGKLYYFRECPEIFQKADYIKNAITLFFKNIERVGINKEHFKEKIPVEIEFDADTISDFKKYIESKITDKKFLNLMLKADELSEKTGFSIWESCDFSIKFFEEMGLNELPVELYSIAIIFLWSMRSAAYNKHILSITKSRNRSYFSAVRAISSKIVAEELGLSHLITDAKFCRLVVDDDYLFGVLSNAALGNRMKDTELDMNSSYQKEYDALCALDVVCMQTDHGPNNYNVYVSKDKKVSICAFDNDNPNTFLPFNKINFSLSGCERLVDDDGLINRPCFDRSVVENISKVSYKRLKSRLKPYLNSLQISAVISRLKKLNKAFDDTQRMKKDFLVDVDD